MKTALILTGHMRCWKQTFSYFKKEYIDKYEADVYIHTWDTEGWWQWGDFYKESPKVHMHELKQYYNPLRVSVENFSFYENLFLERSKNFTNCIGWPKNAISMMYKWHEGINMLMKDYDFIIRTRSDLEIIDPLPNFNPDLFYTIEHPGLNQGGLGDMFHAGNKDNMIKFSNIYNDLENIYEDTNVFCPHLITDYYIKKLQLNHNEFKANYILHNTPWGRHQDVKKYIGVN